MLKIPEIPNPFSLAFSSYKMTDFGKLFFGSMAVEAIANEMNSGNSEPVQHMSDEQRAWDYYNKLFNFIVQNNYVDSWNKLPKEEKQKRILSTCTTKRPHLIPLLQRYVFPSL